MATLYHSHACWGVGCVVSCCIERSHGGPLQHCRILVAYIVFELGYHILLLVLPTIVSPPPPPPPPPLPPSLPPSLLSPHRPTSSFASLTPTLPLMFPLLPILLNLLIQHNAIHTRLEQRKHQTRLPFQPPQPIQHGCAGRIGQLSQQGAHLHVQSQQQVQIQV